MSNDPNLPLAATAGELLPRVDDAFGLRYKLATYSLDITHDSGGPKARGFERILGITIEAIDYLEAQIMARLRDAPISEVRDRSPYGISCVVEIPIRGIGGKANRVVNVRTVWIIRIPGDAPRLVTAYPKP
jgi:hypothetical protein